MKKTTLITSIACMVTVMALGFSGCGKKNADDKKAENNKLVVGTEAGFAPYEYLDDGNNIVGVDMDIAKAIADELGMELEIKNMDFDGALLQVQ